jgi:hypothetical protein
MDARGWRRRQRRRMEGVTSGWIGIPEGGVGWEGWWGGVVEWWCVGEEGGGRGRAFKRITKNVAKKLVQNILNQQINMSFLHHALKKTTTYVCCATCFPKFPTFVLVIF